MQQFFGFWSELPAELEIASKNVWFDLWLMSIPRATINHSCFSATLKRSILQCKNLQVTEPWRVLVRAHGRFPA